MGIYQGVVSDIKDKNKAEIIIYPMSEGIPNVPSNINEIVCHTPSDGSKIKIEAINSHVNAEVGDLVKVKYKPPGIVKNILLLIALPVLTGILVFTLKGLILGIIAFLFGLGVGGLFYKMSSKNDVKPVVVGVLKKKGELINPACPSGQKNGANCQSCPLTLR